LLHAILFRFKPINTILVKLPMSLQQLAQDRVPVDAALERKKVDHALQNNLTQDSKLE
jgi:hypothetical protein